MEKLKILFAGDFCIRGNAVENLDKETIEKNSAPVRTATSNRDISVVNVETVFTDVLSPAEKSGPALSSPLSALDYLKSYGFTIGAMANNHVCDQGYEKGLLSKQSVQDCGMLTMGYGKNLCEAKQPIRIEKKGMKISFLNYAENEFTAATPSKPGFAPINFYENAVQVREEKATSDFVFVMLHAGNEHCPIPRKGVKDFCRALIDAGADGVIISHPHCPQGISYYKEKPIVYSMGNFFMSDRDEGFSRWNTGYMADITINDDSSVTAVPVPYEFASDCSSFSFMEGERKELFLKYLDTLSKAAEIADEEEYQNLMYAWSIMYMEDMSGFIDSVKDDRTFNGEYMLFIKNAFSCESHREVMKNYFTVLTTGQLENFEEYKEKIKALQKLPF